jgi:hypothetical protein
MEIEFDSDGAISAELAVEIARAAFDKLHKGAPFLPPLAKLLLIANDPLVDVSYQLEASRDALPYYHRKLPEIVGPVAMTDLGPCETARQIVEAQTKVMQMMAKGQITPATGKTYIESLALMARTRDLTEGPAAGVLRIEGGMPDLQTEDLAPDNVTPFPSDRDEQASAQTPSKATG